MDRVNGLNWVNISTTPGVTRRGFRSKNKAAGLSGTEVTADHMNASQEEILAVIEAAGLTPSNADYTQLLQALKKIVSGYAPVGGFLLWPFSASTPSGYLKLNGALVSRTTYSALWTLAQGGPLVTDAIWNVAANFAWGSFSSGDLTTTFRLPDLRGEFLRFWDDGRGVDAGRTMGSWQKGSPIGGEDGGANSVVSGERVGNVPGYYDAPDVTAYGAFRSFITDTGVGGAIVGNFNTFAIARPRNVPLIPLIRAL